MVIFSREKSIGVIIIVQLFGSREHSRGVWLATVLVLRFQVLVCTMH